MNQYSADRYALPRPFGVVFDARELSLRRGGGRREGERHRVFGAVVGVVRGGDGLGEQRVRLRQFAGDVRDEPEANQAPDPRVGIGQPHRDRGGDAEALAGLFQFDAHHVVQAARERDPGPNVVVVDSCGEILRDRDLLASGAEVTAVRVQLRLECVRLRSQLRLVVVRGFDELLERGDAPRS